MTETAGRHVFCCVCGETRVRPWRAAGDNLLGGGPAVYQAVRCVRCGTARLDPQPPPEAVAAFYPPTLYARAEDTDNDNGVGRRLDLYNAAAARRAESLFAGGTVHGKSVLDVGCGDGRFLAALQARGAAHVTGLETDPVAAHLARRRTSATIIEGALETADLPDAGFDLVSLLHVLEHVPDPRQTLAHAWRVLRPGGALLLAQPNAASWEARLFGRAWYHLDLPRHLWGFGPHALVRLVEESGFVVSGLRYFPFLFAPQSVRNALRRVRARQQASGARRGGSAGRFTTRLFAGWLGASERLGRVWPGEIMELSAHRSKPRIRTPMTEPTKAPATNNRVAALVLAGGKVSPEMRAAAGGNVENRALIALAGRPLLDYVVTAVRAGLAQAASQHGNGTGDPGRILVALPDPAGAPAGCVGVSSGTSLVDTLLAGVAALAPNETHLLVVTADIPFLTGPAVADFLQRAQATGAQFAWPIVPAGACEARFPGMRRTTLRVQEGTFTGGNLALLDPAFLRAREGLLREAYARRKSVVGLARLLGPATLLRLAASRALPGLLSIADAEAAVGRALGTSARAVVSAYAEIASDVDKPEDLQAARRWMDQTDQAANGQETTKTTATTV